MEIWTPNCVLFGDNNFVKCGFGKGSKRSASGAARGWGSYCICYVVYSRDSPRAFPSIQCTMALNLRDLPGEYVFYARI